MSRFSPAGVSMISAVPQARPPAGQRAACGAATSHFSRRPTSACHCARPRSRSNRSKSVPAPAPRGISGRTASPPVRSDSVAVRISADETSICPVDGLKSPAALATSRGSLISRLPSVAVSFSISAPARVTCQTSPRAASAAEARTRPPNVMPPPWPSTSASSRGCHRPRSPASDQSADKPSDCGAGRTHAAPRSWKAAPGFTIAPPVSVISSRSSPETTNAWAASTSSAPPATPPEASPSSEISSSLQVEPPGVENSKFERLAETLAVAAASAPVLPRSICPRALPAILRPCRSSTSAASCTSLSMSMVHCRLEVSAVPVAENSIAGEATRASSMRRRSPRAGPRRPRSQAVKGSFQRSCRSPCTAARSREEARTSSTRSLPSACAAAESCNCPAVTRTSGRTVSPPGMALAAAVRSMSATSAKSSPISDSAHSQAVVRGSPIRPDASALNRGDDALRFRIESVRPSLDRSNGISQRSSATSSASVSERQTASCDPDTMPAILTTPSAGCRGCDRCGGGSEISSRTSARPSSKCAASNRVAHTLETPSGTRLPATASVRGASEAGISGEEIDQPPSRASVAVAPAAIVVRSRRGIPAGPPGGAGGGGRVTAAVRSRTGSPACSTRPEIVQPARAASGRTAPAAITSVIRQASRRSRSTSSIAPSTTSSSNDIGTAADCTTAARNGARMSSRLLPPRRISTSASPPMSRTVPRCVGSSASPTRP